MTSSRHRRASAAAAITAAVAPLRKHMRRGCHSFRANEKLIVAALRAAADSPAWSR